jgi:hypothetical protein
MRKAGEPADEHVDAFNEDLARILLGESLPLRASGTPPASDCVDVLRQARPLAEDLARLARQLEASAVRAAPEMTREIRRIREVATSLAEILSLSRIGRGAA